VGDNSSGFQNETDLVTALDNKHFKEINSNLQNFIHFICDNVSESDIILCKKIGGQCKCDLEISVKSTLFHLSLKKGSGNSVHQEPIDTFITHLKDTVPMSGSIEDFLKFFVWGDGTTDGSGEKKDRLSASEIKNRYPEKIEAITSFFLANRESLLHRFLFSGIEDNVPVDGLYYGTSKKGLWAWSKEIKDFMRSQNNTSPLSIYNLSFQAWNRAINGTSEHKRGVVQLKWASLERNLQSIKENRDGKK